MFGGGLGLGAGLGASLPTPPYANNLRAWYRSDRRVSVLSGNVTGWGDISGNGLDSHSIASHHPTYTAVDATWNNLPSINFLASGNQYLEYAPVGFNIAQPLTIIWIGLMSTTVFGSMVDGRGAGLIGQNGAAKAGFYAGTFVNSGIAVTSPSFVAGVFAHAGGNSAQYVDSSTASSTSDPGAGIIGGGVGAGYLIGANNGLSNASTGSVVEVFIYGEAVSQPNIATIVAYAATRYGQSWS